MEKLFGITGLMNCGI